MKTNNYKLFTFLMALFLVSQLPAQSSNSLVIVGISEGPANGAKLTEFYALKDIPDLSVFGVGTANNGGGTDSIEFSFPAVSIAKGTSFFLGRDSTEFHDFYGFPADFNEPEDNPANTFNGDDAYELFENGIVVDVFGEINEDGSGTPWEYTDGWAKRKNGTGPDDTIFVVDNWMYSGIDVFDGFMTNMEAGTPYPMDPYSPSIGPSNSLILVGISEGPTNGAKLTEFYALKDIPDLSVFGVGTANNGGGTDSIEFSFPAVSIAKGTSFFLGRDSTEFHDFYGFPADFNEPEDNPANTFNGDDAYELFENGMVVDVFGEINEDGSGTPWEYTDGWAKRKNGTGPDDTIFVVDNWVYSGIDVFDGFLTNMEAGTPYPLEPYSPSVGLNNSLILVGISDGPSTGNKLTEFYVQKDIPDLSIYGVGSANNGGGSDSVEYSFPAVAVSKGTIFYLARDSTEFHDFYGFPADFIEDDVDPIANTFNGNDAYEVFENGVVIDVFGEINVDGTGEPWEHTDGWAYRKASTGPDGSTFVLSNWTISSLDVFDGVNTNIESSEPYPAGSYTVDPCLGASPVVITEIMYNSPGADYEYLELYNSSGGMVDMTGYSFSGVDFVFPDFQLADGEFVLVSADSVRTEAYYGVPSFQWTGGSLNNSGELITLFDKDGNIVDCVDYGTSGEWSSAANGDGPSLVLCDPLSENSEAVNWSGALTGTGVIVDGREIYGNPGAGATCEDNPVITFEFGHLTMGESMDTIAINVYIENPADTETTIDVTLVSGGTADEGQDFMFTDVTLTFPAMSTDPQIVQFGLIDDSDAELSESFTLQIGNATNNAIVQTANATIRIIDNDTAPTEDLILVGINTGPSTPLKTTEYYAVNDIADLSVYGIGSANNGGGSDGIEYRFPPVSVSAGTCFSVTRDTFEFNRFFGFSAAFEDNGATVANSMNGDDAFELFQNEQVIDVFGDINMDGTGTAWDYANGWAHRIDGTGPDGTTFVEENWTYSGVDAYAGDEILNDDATNPYPAQQCFTTGIELIDLGEEIFVYPNPASSEIFFQTNLEVQEIILTNVLGQLIMHINHPGNQRRINVSNLSSDVYFISFIVDHKLWTEKIIIQK